MIDNVVKEIYLASILRKIFFVDENFKLNLNNILNNILDINSLTRKVKKIINIALAFTLFKKSFREIYIVEIIKLEKKTRNNFFSSFVNVTSRKSYYNLKIIIRIIIKIAIVFFKINSIKRFLKLNKYF